jgi:3,4-dihydroxy 2-butanone 4-phosphate synthase/GTP cyclohydrolase II
MCLLPYRLVLSCLQICISMEGQDLDRLKLPLMVQSAENDESMYTAFTITLDLRVGTTTGISAADRAATLRAMADPSRNPDDFRRPGHIFPLRYRQGGVIVRPGHTEAAVDLARASGSYPAGVLCEIVDRSDGSMARTPQLMQFAKQHGLKIITIADLIRYRLRHEQLLQQVAAAPLETRHGTFTAYCYKSLVDGFEHAALVAGDLSSSSSKQHESQASVLACIQQQHHLTDVFGSLHCGQGPFLDQAMAQIAAAGAGVVLYVQGHSTTGSGLAAELEQYTASQQTCRTTDPSSSSSTSSDSSDSLAGANRSGASSSLSADLRDAAAAAHMLKHLGVPSVRLMTDDESDVQRLKCCGIDTHQVTQWPSPAAESLGFGSSSSSSRAHLQAMLEMTNGGSSSSSSSSLNGTPTAAAGASH